MKHRGLDPQTRVMRWGLYVLAIVGVLAATGPSAVALLVDWLSNQQESLPWYASRLFGFLAYWALAASVIYGLLMSTGILDVIAHRAVSFTLHQELSALAIGFTALHGGVLALDTFVQTTVVELIVPFTGPYEPLWVGIGQVAFYLMVAVYASFHFRKRLGQRGWRMLHYTTFLVFVAATGHGIVAGTDSPTAWATWSYGLASLAVVFLLGYRITLSLAQRGGGKALTPVRVKES